MSCGSLEHKMGIHGNATCVMNYDGAKGWLLGDLHKGMRSSQGVRSFVVKVDLRRLGGDVESAYERFMGDNVRTLRPVKEAS